MTRHDNIVSLHRGFARSDNLRGPALRIVEPEPFDLHANFRSHEPVRDSSTGGWFGIAVMVVVSAAIGAMLAVML